MLFRWKLALILSLLAAGLPASSASAAATGSVRFEIVDSISGESLPATVIRFEDTYLLDHYGVSPGGATGIPTGAATFVAVYGKYGGDQTPQLFDGGGQHTGTIVTVPITEGEESLVRFEMDPPARLRFRAVSEKDGSVVSPLQANIYPSAVYTSAATSLGNGWYEADIHPAPAVPLLHLQGQSQLRTYSFDPVASYETLTVDDELEVAVPPTISGTVVDPTGKPVAGARVATTWVLTGPGDLGVLTDSQGRFEFSNQSTSAFVAAFPPASRTDLAAGGVDPGGLAESYWGEERHRTATITLPYGQWVPAQGTREAPTASDPIKVFAPDGFEGSGINIVDTGGVGSGGWTATGHRIESWRLGRSFIIDLHPSLRPTTSKRPTLGPVGGAALGCTLDLDCSVHRTEGRHGDQLVVTPSTGVMSWNLLYGTGAQSLLVDPPLVFGNDLSIQYLPIAVSTADGCQTPFAVTDGQYLVSSTPAAVPGSPELSASAGEANQSVRFTAGGASAVVNIDVSTERYIDRPGIFATAFGGLLPATCVPPTTTTTTTTTTSTTSTTVKPTTTTSTTSTTVKPTTTAGTTTTSTSTSTTTSTTNPTATGTTSTPTTTASTSTTSTTSSTTTSTTSTTAPLAESAFGYAVTTERGTVYTFGDVDHRGNAEVANATAIVMHPSGDGYWIVDELGTIHAFGAAKDLGKLDAASLNNGERVTTMAATPSGDGYWIITNMGRVVAFGTAKHHGDLITFVLAGEIIDAAATPSGKGYYLVGSDGGIFAFGDAKFVGSVPEVLPGVTLDSPVVGLTPDPDGYGYWLVAGDGGVFGFAAPFRNSLPGVLPPGTVLASPVNGMVPYGNGYLLVAGDGGVFNLSNKPFYGSLGGITLDSPVVGISAR